MKRWGTMAGLAVGMLLGCSGISFDRKVENNTFVSPADPEVRIQVNPSIRYVGKTVRTRHHQDGGGAKGLTVSCSSYLFLETGMDSMIGRGVIIRVDKISRGSWKTDLFADVRNKAASDYLEMGGRRYEHFLAVRSGIFSDEEMDLLMGRGETDAKPVARDGKMNSDGLMMPKCFMTEAFGTRAGAGSDTRMCVYYFEDLAQVEGGSSCDDWIQGGIPAEDEEVIKIMFMSSRESAVTFHRKPQESSGRVNPASP